MTLADTMTQRGKVSCADVPSKLRSPVLSKRRVFHEGYVFLSLSTQSLRLHLTLFLSLSFSQRWRLPVSETGQVTNFRDGLLCTTSLISDVSRKASCRTWTRTAQQQSDPGGGGKCRRKYPSVACTVRWVDAGDDQPSYYAVDGQLIKVRKVLPPRLDSSHDYY